MDQYAYDEDQLSSPTSNWIWILVAIITIVAVICNCG